MPSDPHLAPSPDLSSRLAPIVLEPALRVDRCDLHENVRADPGDLTGLTESIRAEGVKEPISVIKIGDRYSVIKGQRRFLANKAAGNATIPALVHPPMDEIKIVGDQLIENIQREGMGPPDIHRGLMKLLQTMKQVEAARKMGMSAGWVSKAACPKDLPEPAKAAFFAGKFGFDQAHAIVTSPEPMVTFESIMGGATRDQARRKSVEEPPPDRPSKKQLTKIPLGGARVIAEGPKEMASFIALIRAVLKDAERAQGDGLTLRSFSNVMADRAKKKPAEAKQKRAKITTNGG